MIKIVKPETSCEPRYILQNLEATKNKADKIDYIHDTLERCAITTPTTKKKRVMSGYNCFTKVQYKIEKKSAKQENRKPIPFKEMLKARGWSQLEDKSKTRWDSRAKEGCDSPRLWEKNL